MDLPNRVTPLCREGNIMAEGSNESAAGAAAAAGVVALVEVKERKQHPSAKRLAQLIERFNQRYCVVNDQGATVVFEEVADPICPGHSLLYKYTFGDFKRRYNNRLLTVEWVDPITHKPQRDTKSYGNWWLDSPDRREALKGVTFDPTGNSAGKGWWNLWNGFAVEPRRGNWELMKQHVFHIVCRGDRDFYDFLMNTAARLVQHPELPAEVCVVLQGIEGCGKGIFLWALHDLFGGHALYLSNPDHLRGRFNEHLQNKVYLFADEAFYAGDKAHESILKALITEDRMAIEPKNRRLFETRNHLHVWMASNMNWVVPASLNARRWAATECLDTRANDTAYFEAIVREKRNGGLGAMLYELRRRDLSLFNPRKVPLTDALLKQKKLSLKTLYRWLIDVFDRGYWVRSRYGVKSLAGWHEFALFEFVSVSYHQWCNDRRIYVRQPEAELRDLLEEMFPVRRPRGRFPMFEVDALPPDRVAGPVATNPGQYGLSLGDDDEVRGAAACDPLEEVAIIWGEWKRGYEFGGLEEARAKFAEKIGLPMPWEIRQ
jgi:hypothetical protein